MVIEIGLLFALGAMLAWGFGDFFIQRCTRKIGNVEALAFIGIIGSISLLPFIIKDISQIFSFSNMILLLFLGILVFIVALFNFEAFKKGKLSVVDVILEFELPVTIILGFIFFKESLSSLQFVIISFIFLSIILIATKSFKHLKVKIEKGVYLALITAVGLGIINFLTAFSAREITPMIAVWFPWTLFSVFCLIYIIKREGLNQVKNHLWQHDGVKASREAIRLWIKKYSVFLKSDK